MPEINITVMGKVASSDTRSIVNGNSDYVVKWTLDSEWSDFDTKTMRVRHYDGTVIDCIFTGCSCSLPIITETCMIEIGLFAGNLITSTPATISCTRCIMDDEGPVKDPMPDVYAQIMERLDSLEGITPATTDKLGVVKIGDNLKITEDGVLSVDTAEAVEQDNTKPATSAAVHTAKSNIEALLGNLSELETEEKDNLVVAVNEVKQTADAKANAADLAPVATSGSYSDLTDQPTIPSVPTATIEANAAARHTHNNKTLLDSITEAVKTAWNTASEWVSTNGANVLSHLSDGVRHITETERSAWNDKQDTISDLEAIRSGASKGATALQSVPSSFRTAAAQDVIDSGLSDRVSAIEGKEEGWNGKYSKPTGGIPKADLANDVQVSLGKADTALQEHQSLAAYRTAAAQDDIDSGKVDKVTGKGLSSNDYTDAAKAKVDALAPVATSGSYNDLTNKPTIPTAYDDTEVRQRIGAIEAKESTWDAKSNFSGNYNDLTDKPTIPAPVTEQTVSGWGFTKNTGTYSKPTGGIPKADLANDVQASLGKADTALQEHQSLAAYRTAEAQNIIDNSKQDKITSTNKLAYSLISGTPTIPTVPTNVSAFTNDAGYLTLATLPKYEGVVE